MTAVVLARARRYQRLLVDGGLGLVLVCLVSTVVGVLYGTGEFWRFGIQEAVGIGVAAVLLGAAALDSYLRRLCVRNRGISQATATTTAAEGGSSVYARH